MGGVAGLLFGGVWIGAAVFAAASYVVRQEDNDVAKALKGVSGSALQVLNFGSYINDKYEVTGKVGGAIKGAVGEEGAKTIDSVVESVKSADKDIGIKDSLGKIATSAGDIANQAVEKAIETNKEYKLTDQIVEKVSDVTKNVGK